MLRELQLVPEAPALETAAKSIKKRVILMYGRHLKLLQSN
jgi:hypothetical protein